MEDDSPNVVTHLELCTFLKVSYRTLTTWRQQGIIPFFKIGHQYRYNIKEVVQTLREETNHVNL